MRASNVHGKDPELRANLFWFEMKCFDEQIEELQKSEEPKAEELLAKFQSKRNIVSQLARPPK